MAKSAWALWGLLVCGTASSTAAWEEYDKLIDKHKAIATLGPQMFGDAVDLYTGTLSFSTTDVSLPGNSALPVAVTRKYTQANSGTNPTHGNTWGGDQAFADWEISVPNISGTFAQVSGGGWPNNRCDVAMPPDVIATGDKGAFAPVAGDLYWAGNSADMPGGGGTACVGRSVAARTPGPSTHSPRGSAA